MQRRSQESHVIGVGRVLRSSCHPNGAAVLKARLPPGDNNLMRFAKLGALATALAVAVAPAASAWAAADPVSPAPAPAVVETAAPYVPQVTCDPVARPGTTALRDLLLTTYGGRDLGMTRSCASEAGTSEHKDGRAFDWGLLASNPAEAAIAQQFLDWLLKAGPDGKPYYNARRLGVMYLIWNGRIWGSYTTTNGGWKAYTGSVPHTDHIHISLSWNGAMKRTSFWTGTVAPTDYGPCVTYTGVPADPWTAPRLTPCPTPSAAPTVITAALLRPYFDTQLSLGSTGAAVVVLQQALGVTADGAFGPVTQAAVKAFSTAHGLIADGVVRRETWEALSAGTRMTKGFGKSLHWMPGRP